MGTEPITTSIEIVKPLTGRGRIRYALFDFDGTLSLIREGWQGVMVPMMVEQLMETPFHEDMVSLTQIVTEFVDHLTGKQTIYQMIRLCEEIEQRGGNALDPLEYKHLYLDRLNQHIQDRVDGLTKGTISAEELMVPGSVQILDELQRRNIHCYLASGTDEEYIKAEANALMLDHYFDGIYGARDDYHTYSKKIVIEKIIKENNLLPEELVVFGDGYVEVENIAAIGGIAVGVASDEANRVGIDNWKRLRLIKAGADLIIPDFRPFRQLVGYLFAED